jgi:hypothetical protein
VVSSHFGELLNVDEVHAFAKEARIAVTLLAAGFTGTRRIQFLGPATKDPFAAFPDPEHLVRQGRSQVPMRKGAVRGFSHKLIDFRR